MFDLKAALEKASPSNKDNTLKSKVSTLRTLHKEVTCTCPRPEDTRRPDDFQTDERLALLAKRDKVRASEPEPGDDEARLIWQSQLNKAEEEFLAVDRIRLRLIREKRNGLRRLANCHAEKLERKLLRYMAIHSLDWDNQVSTQGRARLALRS